MICIIAYVIRFTVFTDFIVLLVLPLYSTMNLLIVIAILFAILTLRLLLCKTNCGWKFVYTAIGATLQSSKEYKLLLNIIKTHILSWSGFACCYADVEPSSLHVGVDAEADDAWAEKYKTLYRRLRRGRQSFGEDNEIQERDNQGYTGNQGLRETSCWNFRYGNVMFFIIFHLAFLFKVVDLSMELLNNTEI